MDKNSFLIYLDYEEQFNLLSNEEAGILIKAIMQYEKTGEIVKLDGMVKMAFSFIKTQLDRDREKYQEKCEKNKNNARKRWNAKNANAQSGIENDTKNADNDNEDEEDIEDDNDDVAVDKESQLQKRFIECIGSTNLNSINECISYLDDLPYEVIEKALEKASRASIPNWNYAKIVLDDWVKKKIDTIEKVEIEEQKFKKNKKANNDKANNHNNYEQRNYEEDDLRRFYANKGG